MTTWHCWAFIFRIKHAWTIISPRPRANHAAMQTLLTACRGIGCVRSLHLRAEAIFWAFNIRFGIVIRAWAWGIIVRPISSFFSANFRRRNANNGRFLLICPRTRICHLTITFFCFTTHWISWGKLFKLSFISTRAGFNFFIFYWGFTAKWVLYSLRIIRLVCSWSWNKWFLLFFSCFRTYFPLRRFLIMASN